MYKYPLGFYYIIAAFITIGEGVEMTVNKSEYSNVRAARGQALNLAVNEAISIGKAEDNKYILKRFLHYYNLSNLIQSVSLEDLEKELLK